MYEIYLTYPRWYMYPVFRNPVLLYEYISLIKPGSGSRHDGEIFSKLFEEKNKRFCSEV
jgi:hypothetical protein